MIYLTQEESPLGQLTLAAKNDQLLGIWVAEQSYFGAGLLEDSLQKDDLALFHESKAWLQQYFTGQRPDPRWLPLAPQGSPFRQAVWSRLMDIPYGQVVTYGSLAQELAPRFGHARPSARAIGNAVGHNPLTIVIPCHRVIGAGGKITGFASGLDRKRWLLAHEGYDTNSLS